MSTMLRRIRSFLLALLTFSLLSEGKLVNKAKHNVRTFPDNFLFGVATAAYQIEGGWDAEGKAENIWDYLTHNNPCVVKDCQNGDIANDSYNQYKRDVEMMRELGLDVYRFSISWSRVLPTSFPDQINQAGVNYYNNLINEMLKYNIQPMVTIHHWDIPQKVSLMGGWTNPHIVDWFGDYSRVLFELFGDRVKYWITINEPLEICYQGYGAGTKAPQLNISGYAEYLCAKNILMAHATAYHIYDKEYRSTQNGTIGISLGAMWYEPETEDHTEITEQVHQFESGQYAYPIFSTAGDWPVMMKERVAEKSTAQGFARSRLPEFTPEEVKFVQGSSDFYGLNHYTTNIVYHNASVDGYYSVPSYYDDMGALFYQSSEWGDTSSAWFKGLRPPVTPDEVQSALRCMKNRKAVGPDGVPIEAWKSMGSRGVGILTHLFNRILLTGKIPDQWRLSIITPVFKGKGSVQECSNYRGIKVMSHTMKLLERIVDSRIRQECTISECQYGFRPGCGTMDPVFALRTLMEGYRLKKTPLHLLFLDMQKAFDCLVQRVNKWNNVVPWGFYKLLTRIREIYNNPTIFITENGYSNRGGLDDEDRVSFYRSYLDAMLDAIDEGSDVRLYCAWSLMDNFEWMQGYTERFGLYEVNYTSPERTRTPRKSAFVYKEIVRTRALDPHYEPDTTHMTIDEEHN